MLLTLGISHKTAPIEIREKLAFSPGNIPDALKTLAGTVAIEEIALLSTCNRTEFYCSTPLVSALPKQILRWWQEYHSTAFEVTPYLYAFSGKDAVKHIMRVASGLDSMIIGEPQILGQLKAAFHLANQIGVVGNRLSRLFQTSFSVAKKVRHNTGISTHPVSIAFAAVTLARQIFSNLSQATVLLIGAGENIELTIQHLAAKQANKFIIVNRTLKHAEILANRYGGQALPLEALSQGLSQADIVISSIDVANPILTQSHIEQALVGCKRRPIFMVDLGVPRNIQTIVGQNEDIYLYTIDDLQGLVTENLKIRHKAAEVAETIIEDASECYMEWMQSELSTQTIRALRTKTEKIKNDALSVALRQLEKGADPKETLVHLAHQLTQKLMHQPTVNLRKVNTDNDKEKIVLVKELFSIE